MFTMLCINGTTPRPPLHPHPFGCLPLSLPWYPFPLPRARCSVVYISSPRHGAHASRDTILSLVLAPGALYKELGERGDTGNGNRAEAGAEIGAG
uniref:Uncharacterized protein n=1 Tax=Panthera tigris altaica TaxID=74533 RepID=A0A8C9JNH0_PANTA